MGFASLPMPRRRPAAPELPAAGVDPPLRFGLDEDGREEAFRGGGWGCANMARHAGHRTRRLPMYVPGTPYSISALHLGSARERSERSECSERSAQRGEEQGRTHSGQSAATVAPRRHASTMVLIAFLLCSCRRDECGRESGATIPVSSSTRPGTLVVRARASCAQFRLCVTVQARKAQRAGPKF